MWEFWDMLIRVKRVLPKHWVRQPGRDLSLQRLRGDRLSSSTNAFDKNPQSQERGITLDLGFSSFMIDVPQHLAHSSYQQVQITMVDCPGHASLIRTIIGGRIDSRPNLSIEQRWSLGAQIIDLMLLVIDITKGIQTQTAECLIIGEITCDRMIVVLNKIDQIEEEQRATTIDKVKRFVQWDLFICVKTNG